MQLTTTLQDILQSELIKHGKNEFVNKVNGKTQITDANRDFAFIYKIMTYDSDVQEIVDLEFFNGFKIEDSPAADKYFKTMFVNRFLDRQVGPQTVEAFSTKVTSVFLQHMVEIKVLYEELEDYYHNKSQTDSTESDKNGWNELKADLPQDEVNMSLTADTQDYADDNTIHRGFDDKANHAVTTTLNPDAFAKLQNVWESVLNIFDRRCFLQIY